MTKLDKKADSVTATIETARTARRRPERRPGDLRRRRRRQYREPRAREARREDRPRQHRRRRPMARPTCPASTRSATSPGPPMLAHKAEHEGVICVEAIKGLHPHADGQAEDPRLHLLQSADRLGRPHRGEGEGRRPRHPRRPLPLHRQRQGDRARRGPRAWSRRSSTRRPASSSARTWSAPR